MSSTSRRNSAQEKSESFNTKGEQGSGPNSESQKITNFFPVLRNEGRAKMCASKTGDSKQKEILQKLQGKDMGLSKPKKGSSALLAEKDTAADSLQSKERPQRNISVMSALKTPLSQVLRKSLEASEMKKETVEDQEEEIAYSKDAQKASEKDSKIKQSARKSFPESETGMSLRRSFKSIQSATNIRTYPKRTTESTTIPTSSTRRRVTVLEPDESAAGKNSKAISLSTSSAVASSTYSVGEEGDHSAGGKMKKNRRRHFRGGTYGLYLSKKSKKKKEKSLDESKDDDCSLAGTENSSYIDSEDNNSMMSEDLYATSEKSLVDEEQSRASPVLASEPKVEFDTQSKFKEEGSMRCQSPERIASSEVSPKATDLTKEMEWDYDARLEGKDDMKPETQTTELQSETQFQSEGQLELKKLQPYGQFAADTEFPSEDPLQCKDDSFQSEGNKPQEESEATEPGNQHLQSEDDQQMQYEEEQIQDKNQETPPNTLQSESEFKQKADSFSTDSLKAPQYDDISNESFSNSTFLFKSSPALSGDSDKKETDLAMPEKVEETISKLDDSTEDMIPADTSKSEVIEFMPVLEEKGSFDLSEISTNNSQHYLAMEQNENEIPVESQAPLSLVLKSGEEVDGEEKYEDLDGQSTIATCVKSRQRIKRRFTDDVVDTDLGILSLHSAMVAPRKPPVPAPPRKDPPKNVIQTFEPVTHREAKRGPIAKIECIYNTHQEPIKSCTCNGETFEANLSEEDEGVFCQAVDSIDDKLVGCSNSVVTPMLVRPSVKIPFTIMCEMHLWRLRHHHSCPYCGLFCSQGSFMQCLSKEDDQQQRVIHLYHEHCQAKEEGMAPFCLHCGETSRLKKVQLEMHMASPPSFFLSQLKMVDQPVGGRARISFSVADYLKKPDSDPNSIEYTIEDSGKVLSSVGLQSGPEKDELDRLLQLLKEEKGVPTLYELEELFDAVTEENLLKVLNLLAQGVDPNKKFPNHDNETALHAAAAGGNITIVHLLIQAGAVNDPVNEKMHTPLMLASESNRKDIALYLVKNGAAADFKGDNGMSSFHIAAKCGNLEVLKILMTSRDVDINAQDDGGWTPIVWASEHDHYDVVKHLLKSGANPNLKDNEGNTGLHWSAFSGSVDICFLYLEYGCDIDAANERGDSPLHIASRQDSLPCVTLLLSRGADSHIKNKSDLIPAECVLDKNSDVYLSLSLNLLLKKIANRYQHKAEKILHKDISRGKEQIAIQCVNEVDNEPPPLDFLYVTENCETTPMNIDRTITSLQSCNCEDDCSSASCTCAAISYQCWYDKDGLLLPNFNMVDPPMLFECNRACSCWSLNCRNRILQSGMSCRLQLVRTKGKGWGVRTLKDIPKGTFICEYVGEMISDSAADKRADDSYLFDLDNRDGETYCLDARYYGNISRFINHLCEPNLVPVKVYVDHQDLNFPRIAFFSSRDIKQYEELGFDYCEKFWVIKYKYFTCDCGSSKCKYSKDTIHQTLANYYRRVREEQMLEEQQQQPMVVTPTEIQTID